MSSYADTRGEALPWWMVLVEGIVVALLGAFLLIAPVASLVFLMELLGLYLLMAGIFRIIGIFLDSSSWGWKLAAGILCLIAGLAILSNPLWSTTLASTWLVIPGTSVNKGKEKGQSPVLGSGPYRNSAARALLLGRRALVGRRGRFNRHSW